MTNQINKQAKDIHTFQQQVAENQNLVTQLRKQQQDKKDPDKELEQRDPNKQEHEQQKKEREINWHTSWFPRDTVNTYGQLTK